MANCSICGQWAGIYKAHPDCEKAVAEGKTPERVLEAESKGSEEVLMGQSAIDAAKSYQIMAGISQVSNSPRKGISSMQIAKEIGVTQKAAWFMLHRLREACGGERITFTRGDAQRPGIVEAIVPSLIPGAPPHKNPF